MATKTKTPARPHSDRGQGRKTIDPRGEVMQKVSVRLTAAQRAAFDADEIRKFLNSKGKK